MKKQENNKKNLIYILPFFPYPLDAGGKIRPYNKLKYLSPYYRIYLFSFYNDEDDIKPGLQKLKEFCEDIYLIKLEKTTGVGYIQLFKDCLKYPPSFFNKFHSPQMIQKINALNREITVSVMMFDTQLAGQLLLDMDFPAKKIIDLFDIYDVLLKRNLRNHPFGVYKLKHYLDWLKTVFYEKKIISKFDLVLATSKIDKKLLTKKIDKQKIYVLVNGTTIKKDGIQPSIEKKDQILFVGRYDYFPNLEGFFFFYEKIFPLIKRRYPHFKFFAVGENPTESMLKITGTDKSIIVTGLVEETAPYYQSAKVAVVPLKSGSGTRLKILESFAYKVPVVSTSVGCEGIDVVDRKHLLIADEPQMFANAVIELFENQSLVQKICENSFQLVSSQYSWEKIINNFKKEIDVLLQS